MLHECSRLTLLFVLIATACGGDHRGPAAPSEFSRIPDRASTVGATVVEYSSGTPRPVAAAEPGGWVARANGTGYWLWLDKTDSAGWFQIPVLPDGTIEITVWKSGYVQPCVTTVSFTVDAAVEIEITPITAPHNLHRHSFEQSH